jgi:hypothetical protein
MSRSTNKRSLGTFAALLLVPAVTVAVLSVGTASGDTAPSGVLVSESRAVAFTGMNLPAAPAAAAAEDKKVDEVLTDWQNTVRHRTRTAR